MTHNKLMCSVAAMVVASTTSMASAQDGSMPPMEAMPPQVQLAFNLGSAGLLEKMNSYATYNTTQGRIGLSRTQIEFSHASGITSGFEDSSNVAVLPFDVMYTLPNSNGQSFLRFGGFLNDISGESGNLTQVDSAGRRIDVQYMHAPNIDTLWGVGLFYESTSVDLVHNGGTIDREGWGIRADYVQKFNPHWGIAARADLNFGNTDTTVPIAPNVNYELDQDDTRLYLQGALVGTYTTQDMGWIPNGWVFHPTLTAVFQRTEFDSATNSFGGTATGTVGDSDDYGWIGASARFASMDFRPGKLAPYVEVGLQHEYVNDLDLVMDEPTYLNTVIGASVNLGHGARLDIEYGRNDGLNGKRDDQALTVHIGYLF
jgi:hypothetical protein